MDTYDSFPSRSPPAASRNATRDRPRDRERDDYRSSDPYRDRRRSPDRRRGDRDRRRSRSPLQLDRYQPDRAPRDDYYRREDNRERRRSSPQPQGIDRYVPGQNSPPAQALLVNPLPDPMKLDFQVGFTWFAEWWRAEQRVKEEKERQKAGKPPLRARDNREDRDAERPKIQLAYDQYKENLQKAQAQSFVRQHKNEDWFQERYIASVREPFRQSLMAYRRTLFTKWESDLSSGVFDDFTLEGIYKSESNGAGGILEKEEGEATAAAEVLGVGDLLPTKGGDIRDPVALQPTLLIKTIAPTVSREKFVTFAKEHLGEGEGGFVHLSLSDPNPLKKCHRMGWIILDPTPPDQQMSTSEATTAENGEAGEAAEGSSKATDPGVPISNLALSKINGKTIEDPDRGNFTVHCGVHRPPEVPRKKALWDLFSAPERIARDLELATRLVRKLDNELGDAYFGVAKIEERVHDLAESGRLQPEAPAKTARTTDDMDADIEEGEEETDEVDEDEVDDEEMIMKKKKLDLLVEYLRRVYQFCFFCVFESDSVHELQRKCPGGHLRRPRASLTSAAKEIARASANGDAFPGKKKGDGKGDEDMELPDMAGDSPVDERKSTSIRPSGRNVAQLQRAFNWVKTFEEKVLQILEPENVNLRKLGGTPVEEGVEEELNKFVKQEDVNKFRCKVPDCVKLFKGLDFWRKHIVKRHTEWYEGIQRDVELVNTYVLDPSHIAPSRSDANSNGHFPLNQHLPNGTPRGFQLNQQFPMGFPMVGGMPNVPPGANVFNGSTMLTGQWNGAPGFNGVGPMRSNGRNNANGFGRAPGPYARNDGRGRVPSISGVRGMPGMGMEGGAGAMGPREAVVGRSLRSYEDLDADNGQSTSELNY